MLVQFGAVPIRRSGEEGLQILLVTSRETRRWVVPRGNPIAGLQPSETAAQEAYEEAGVRGAVGATVLGSYRYGKRKRSGAIFPAEVHLYPLEVEELLDEWPERAERERRWFEPAAAADAVDEPELKALLRRLGEERG